ncbi:hypothetical protein ScPMuIL_015638 [Solemya velum]
MAAPSCHILTGVIVFLLYALIPIINGSKLEDEFEGLRTLTVEHSLDSGFNPEFTKRGTVVIRSLKGNKAQFQESSPFDSHLRSKLKTATRENGVYRIRMPTTSTGTLEDGDYVSTFVMACSVYESALSDKLIINVDQTGEVIGISMTTFPSECVGWDMPDSDLTHWNTTVDISQTVQGPVPDTQSYIDKMKREEAERAKGQQGENKSFFGRYVSTGIL